MNFDERKWKEDETTNEGVGTSTGLVWRYFGCVLSVFHRRFSSRRINGFDTTRGVNIGFLGVHSVTYSGKCGTEVRGQSGNRDAGNRIPAYVDRTNGNAARPTGPTERE